MADEQAKMQEIERAASRLEAEMREQIVRTQSATRVTMVIGIIVIAAVAISFYFLTKELKKEAEPKTVVDTMQSLLKTEGAPRLKAALIAQAPEVAKAARMQVMNAIQAGGQLAEKKADEYAGKLVDMFEATADKTVDDLIKSQQDTLKPLIAAASRPDSAKELEEDFTKSLQEIISDDMDKLLRTFDEGMGAIDARLNRFLDPKSPLTVEEQAQKYLIQELVSFINDTSKGMLMPDEEKLPGKLVPPSFSK